MKIYSHPVASGNHCSLLKTVEKIAGWDLDLYAFQQAFLISAAAEHFSYTKSSYLYMQSSETQMDF